MKKIIGSAITLATVVTPALAHPADHSFGMFESLAHLLTQPDHLSLLVVAVVGAFAVFKFRTRKV